MPRLGRFARELRARLWKPSVEEEVQSELSSHLEMLVEDLVARGLDPAAARAAALERFGDPSRIAPGCRDLAARRDRRMDRTEWLGELRQDVRYAVRQLRAAPRFTLAAVLTLAVGLGAVTTIFGIANAVLLRPFPFAAPERLVMARATTPSGQGFAVSEPDYLDWRIGTHRLSDIGAFSLRAPTLRGDGGPEQLVGAAVTHSLFPVLGVAPALGRPIAAEEDRPGGDTRVALISDALWRRRFGGDPRIIGRAVELNGANHRIIGVMPPGFDFPDRVEIWIPLAPSESYHRGDRRLEAVVGRLAPGATAEQAEVELVGVAGQLGGTYPETNQGWGARVEPLSAWYLTPQLRTRLVALLATVGLLLVMACVNVAGLLLARAGTREREIAVRSALGAGSGRILRQLLAEGLVLALLGGGVGIAVAAAAIPLVRGLGSSAIPRLDEMTLDWRVLAFAMAACLTTGVVFGLAPARSLGLRREAGIGASSTLLRSGTRTVAGGGLRSGLVVTSVALAMLLLVSAGLVGRSFVELMRVDLGFSPDRVLTASVAVPVGRDLAAANAGASMESQAIRFFGQLEERLGRLPGVGAAGAVSIAPFSGGNTSMGFRPAEQPEPRPGEERWASWRIVTPGYFGAVGVPLLRGRTFEESDRAGSPMVAVISEAMARMGWPGSDPIGRQVTLSSGRTMTVVGIVGDTRYLFVDSVPGPTMFFPHRQFPWPTMWLTLRTAKDPVSLIDQVRREVAALDPGIAVARAQPLGRLVGESTAEPRLIALVFAIFAGAALVLATIGLYGIVSYSVSQRVREIGVRLALGAPRGRILGRVLGQGLRLAGAGVALGGVASLGVTGVLRAILYQTEPADPGTFLTMGALLLVVAGVASVSPARRAAGADPIATLRGE